jgi:hypothetical protein
VSATALLAKDRREAVDRVENGIFSPGVYASAQFCAMLIYDLGVSFVFVSIFHWLTNLNPHAEVYFYDVAINWMHLALMEGFLVTVIEVLKNDFLATTMGMIFIGTLMAFAGFFRPVPEMPPWINWLCYALPLKVYFTLNMLCNIYFSVLSDYIYCFISKTVVVRRICVPDISLARLHGVRQQSSCNSEWRRDLEQFVQQHGRRSVGLVRSVDRLCATVSTVSLLVVCLSNWQFVF